MKPQENHETGGKQLEKEIIGQQFKMQCVLAYHAINNTETNVWPTFYKLTNYKTHNTY